MADMIYVIVGLILSLWFALLGASSVLSKHIHSYIFIIPSLILFLIGIGADTISEHLGYKSAGRSTGLDFYIFIFTRDWALSIFVITSALICYELSKFSARYYRLKNPAPRNFEFN